MINVKKIIFCLQQCKASRALRELQIYVCHLISHLATILPVFSFRKRLKAEWLLKLPSFEPQMKLNLTKFDLVIDKIITLDL